MIKNLIKTIVHIMAAGLLLQACAHGPYKGRVVEEDSGLPVVGAVAIGDWTGVHVNVAGGTTYCIDAREALTDEKGEFEILDISRGTFSISVYKVGYQRVQCPWESLQRWGGCMTEPAQWDGDRAIILLNKVAKSRMGYEGRPPSGGCGRKDGKPLAEYMKAHEDYRRALGLKH
jgi:hypothetical protein